MNLQQGGADTRSWQSPPSMPSPILEQGSFEAPLDESALSVSFHDCYDTGANAQTYGAAGAAPQSSEWSHAHTTPGAGWVERASTHHTEAGRWSHSGGAWAQHGWQQYRARTQWTGCSAQLPQHAGWGSEPWRAAQTGGLPGEAAPACQWSQARHASPAQGAKTGPPKSGGKCGLQGPPKSPPKAGAQAAPGHQQEQSEGTPQGEPGLNFKMNPYFKELPPGSPSYRLTQKMKELGLP